VVATDISVRAVESAQRNGAHFGFTVCHGNWFDGLDSQLAGRLDVVVAYLPHTPDRALRHLPRDRITAEGVASFAGGRDGLDHFRTVVTVLSDWLAPAGVLLTLLAAEQAEAGTDIATRARWACSILATPDDDCVLAVTRPVAPSPR